jgi:hypothetical protein
MERKRSPVGAPVRAKRHKCKKVKKQVLAESCNEMVPIIIFLQKQGCRMVCFQTKNINLGKFWRDLE